MLRRGLDVYMTLVDDQQIDCIIRKSGNPPSYIDVQIKARSETAKNAAMFAAMEIREPREGFIFVFYSEACKMYWIMPSLDLVAKANVGKSGKNAGKYKIVFANKNRDGIWAPRPKWSEYENNFKVLGAE